jgi:biopolymer transport protein ExbB
LDFCFSAGRDCTIACSVDWKAVEFFTKGGIFMVPLVGCSLVSLAIIMERGWTLRRDRVLGRRCVALIESLQGREQLPELAKVATKETSSLARLVVTALNHLHGPKSENLDALQVQARHEMLQLERGLVVLEIIVGIGPLLGLLGTVSGLVQIFSGIGAEGIASQGMVIARGISEALNTTVAGLVVAIPSLIFWSYFNKKVEGLAAEMEALCGELLTKVYQSMH